MSSNGVARPRLIKKSSPQQQAVMDEILRVVSDQGKRMSLSPADYRLQQQVNWKTGPTETIKDDSGSWCTSSSDLSYSPPGTPLEFNTAYISESDSEQPVNSVARNERRSTHGLPPLDPMKVKRPTCPPAAQSRKDSTEGSENNDQEAWPVRPKVPRPKSARGYRPTRRVSSRESSNRWEVGMIVNSLSTNFQTLCLALRGSNYQL